MIMRYSFLLLFSMSCFYVFPQEDLLSFFEDDVKENIVFATFKGTKIVNLQSVEMSSKDELQFIISHRFGTLNSGIVDLFGLDYGRIRLSLEYGIMDNVNIGIGRSAHDKIIDASTKFRIVRQGQRNSPVSLSTYSVLLLNPNSFKHDNLFANRLSYTYQLLIARKFSSNFSSQITPTIIHYNLVNSDQNHDILSLGIGSRYKLNRSVSLNMEWIPLIYGMSNINSFSLGFDIETGGHVFQLLLSNSTSMYETGFIAENYEKWNEGGVHFGFNITRRFYFNR